jgi:hypothetical protein
MTGQMIFCPWQFSFGQTHADFTVIVAVDKVDETSYKKKQDPLVALTEMQDVGIRRLDHIASKSRHKTTVLYNENATIENILNALRNVGKSAGKDQTVFLYFLGYGDHIQDKNKDEGFRNGKRPDQAFVAYDGMLIDDSLYVVFNKYYQEELIVMMTDLRHTDSLSVKEHYFLDFETWAKEMDAFKQTLNTQPCEMRMDSYNLANEKFNLAYFGLVEGPSGTMSLSSLLSHEFKMAYIKGRKRSITCRNLACILREAISPSGQLIVYYEIGNDVSLFTNKTIFN